MKTNNKGAVLPQVAKAFANQVAYCLANDAPITARVVTALGILLGRADRNAFMGRIRQWDGAPLADALPLRAAGGLHALHRAGGEPGLAEVYVGEAADEVALIGDVIARREADLLPWLDGPPQTNEAGRSCGFVAALLWLAGQGLPARFQCLEIGSSAGINLMLDRYRYDLGGIAVGPEEAKMRFSPQWTGPPPPDRTMIISSLKGCDVAPVDLSDPEQALRLTAYIWPEHTVRFERMASAIVEAEVKKPDLVHMNAADFVEAELSMPQANGATRVLMHSIVWQYVPADQRARVTTAMARAAALATLERPLAWIALEADRTLLKHELSVQFWPDGAARQRLAWSHAHGAAFEWLEQPVESLWAEA